MGRKNPNSQKSKLEKKFRIYWRKYYYSLRCKPKLEYTFHPTRKWRFDFAWVKQKLAVEIHGGIFIRGGHNRGMQMTKDYEKQREAVRLGWRVLPFGTWDCNDMQAVVQLVAEVLTNAKEIQE